MNQSKKSYVIDTNILINFRIFTPMSIHITFWKQLSEAVTNKTIVIIRDVADECKDREIEPWVNRQEVTEISDDIRERAIEINNKYLLITEEDGIKKSKADPVIIAYAEKNQSVVFTQEAKRKSNSDPMKIPDVCNALSIRCERWPDKVFEDINFRKI